MIRPMVTLIGYKHPQLKRLEDRVTEGLVYQGVFEVSREMIDEVMARAREGCYYPFSLQALRSREEDRTVRVRVVSFDPSVSEEELK